MNNSKILKALWETNNEVNQTISENKLAEGDLNFIELIYNKYSKWYNNLFKEMFKMIKSKKVNKTKTNDSNAEILAAIKNLEINMDQKIQDTNQNIKITNEKIDDLKNYVDEKIEITNQKIDDLKNYVDDFKKENNARLDKLEWKVDLGFSNLKDHFGIDFLKEKKK